MLAGGRVLLAALAVGLSTALLSGCGGAASGDTARRPADQEEAASPESELVPVAAIPLARGPIESVLRYSTNLEAESSIGVYSEAERRVTELLVEEGRRVSKGDVLVRLQDDEQESALARIDSQLAKAEREFARQQRLYGQELISEQAFNDATYELEQLQIAREDALRELGFATVRAPISGVVTKRLVGLGDYVRSNQHLFDIVDFSSIVARIYVPEKELDRLAVGQEARLAVPALGGEARPASILRIAPTVDSQSGTVKVTLSIGDRSQLLPGMFVEVALVAERDENALRVPKRALVLDQDQSFVYRVVPRAGAVAEVSEAGAAEASAADGGGQSVERVRVEPVIEDRDWIEVEDGLAVGDLVVVAGQAGLKPGVAVRLLDLDEALSTFDR
ncbi:MAG: efflux RND transporter periplasmic adaptor subunit [Acidobacteria bacterium]|nr:MAG: efflux RND transporter periplasmic adaptor subunit [Acidobacteriota bacterium]